MQKAVELPVIIIFCGIAIIVGYSVVATGCENVPGTCYYLWGAFIALCGGIGWGLKYYFMH